MSGNIFLYYNIFSDATEAFLGTVAVEIQPGWKAPPYDRACLIARAALPGVGSVRAVISNREMFVAHALRR